MQKIEGGYILVGKEVISHLKARLTARTTTTSEARGTLGLLEMHSIRDAAEALRSKKKNVPTLIPLYTPKELSKITHLDLKTASKVFKRLGANEIAPSKRGKLIPIPRRLVRFLARSEKRSTILVLLTYLERGLSLKDRELCNAGTAKASLLAKETSLTVRTVRTVRANLLELGILSPDTTKYQRKLNRDGAYFTINLSWNDVKTEKQEKSEISPPPAKKSTKISPPYRDNKSSYEFRYQRTLEPKPTGVFTKQAKKSGGEGKVLSPPTIKDVQEADLGSFSRCEELYFQAVQRGLIEPTEAGAINFLAAACRAKSVLGDGPRIFMGIIRKKLWKNITQKDEDRALSALRRYREENPNRFRYDISRLAA